MRIRDTAPREPALAGLRHLSVSMSRFLLLGALVLAACGDPPGPSPEQQAVFAMEVDAELVIPAVRNTMRYEIGRIEAPAGATVRVVMDNRDTTSPAMVHNVVVLSPGADLRAAAQSAVGQPENVPEGPSVIAATPLAGPGQQTAVVFTMPPPGEYPFICTYPGHWQTMQGTLVSTG